MAGVGIGLRLSEVCALVYRVSTLLVLNVLRACMLLPLSHCPSFQWRRSVVKYGQSGQGIKLFQITPYVNDSQTLNNPGYWQYVGASKS